MESSYNPRVREAVSRLSQLAADAQAVITREAESLLHDATGFEPSAEETTLRIDCQPFAEVGDYLVGETLKLAWRRMRWPERGMGYAQWKRLTALAALPTGDGTVRREDFPGGITAERRADALTLTIRRSTNTPPMLADSDD